MAKFMLDGQEYCGGGSQIVELTQDQYDELPDTKKTDNILYAITDCDELSAENMACKDASGNLSNVQDELNVLNENKLSVSAINYSSPVTTLQYNASSETKSVSYTATTNCMVVGYGKGSKGSNVIVIIDGVTVAYLGYVYEVNTTDQIGQHYAPFTYFLPKGSTININSGELIVARVYSIS